MKTRKQVLHVSFLAVLVTVCAWPALAALQPTGWPDANSGAYLGVRIEEVTPEVAASLKLPRPGGALIAYVDQDGPACHAGLKSKDVVIAFNGSNVATPDQLGEFIHSATPGKTVTMTVLRDGQKKDIKVALGAWPKIPSHAVVNGNNFLASMPPAAMHVPDMDFPAFAALSSKNGLVVESLTPQLADFFGVPRGNGVLVRSVENGTPAASAGLRAGDIIVKVNNDAVHDVADWRRGMRGGKVTLGIVREKRAQNVEITMPGPADTSELRWPEFEQQMKSVQQEMEKLRPEMEKQQLEIQKQMPVIQEQIRKSSQLSRQDMERMQQEIQKSLPTQEQVQAMTRQAQDAAVAAQKINVDELQKQIRDSMPSQEEMQKQMQSVMPQLQQQMDEMRQQVEQQKQDLEKQMQEFHQQQEY